MDGRAKLEPIIAIPNHVSADMLNRMNLAKCPSGEYVSEIE
jgi:hypothetical protein